MSKALVIRGTSFSENALDTIQFDVVHCTGISLSANTYAPTAIGATTTLTATVTPSDCGEEVEWSSSNTNCCTVSQSGVVTVVGCGTATITAQCGTQSATCTVTVEIELSGYGRYIKSKVYPANSGSGNDLTAIYSLLGNSYGAYDNEMLMATVDATQARLAVDFRIVTKNTSTNEWEIVNPLSYTTEDDTSKSIGYCVPILLPANCTKIKCEAPADHYGAWALFYSSETPAIVDTPKYASCAHRYPESTTEDNHVWNYSSRTTEFNVPSGADSITVWWRADTGNGASSFNDMAEALLGQFKVVCC